jgi:DNA-binding transcriptional MerR regulator
MNLTTISEISRELNLSTRTLRYYEQIGLIDSVKKDDYAYRTYDEATIKRLHQIIVLRKLRIPLKQIGVILQSENTAAIIDTFRQNLAEVDDEITALSSSREIISSFISRLNESVRSSVSVAANIQYDLLDDTALLEAVDALTVRKIPLKEEKTAADLQAASDTLLKLTDRDVRIVYLPPSTVAAYRVVGDEPEDCCHKVINAFVRDANLVVIKPDIRHFGFNAPNPVDETGYHGYEMWVTIPDDFPVPEPLVKKHFEGGLYAAHMSPFGAFEEWGSLSDWVANNRNFEGNSGDKGGECMWGLLEEQLNYVNRLHLPKDGDDTGLQLDLLHPIKPKAAVIS